MCLIGRGLCLLEYSPSLPPAGNHVDLDGSCSSCQIRYRLCLLEYRLQQETDSWIDSVGGCRSCSIGRGLQQVPMPKRVQSSKIAFALGPLGGVSAPTGPEPAISQIGSLHCSLRCRIKVHHHQTREAQWRALAARAFSAA